MATSPSPALPPLCPDLLRPELASTALVPVGHSRVGAEAAELTHYFYLGTDVDGAAPFRSSTLRLLVTAALGLGFGFLLGRRSA